MSTSLTLLRQGLAANLAALTDVQVSPYMLANPTPPAVTIYPSDVSYDLSMHRGFDLWTFTVQAFVGDTADIGAQVNLDQFIAPSGARSVKTLLESDKTLGGACSDLQVTSCTGYRIYLREGGPPVLGAEWHVTVYAPGT